MLRMQLGSTGCACVWPEAEQRPPCGDCGLAVPRVTSPEVDVCLQAVGRCGLPGGVLCCVKASAVNLRGEGSGVALGPVVTW